MPRPLGGTALLRCNAPAGSTAEGETDLRIEIICTGDEVLTGKIVNTNFSYITQKLEDVGLSDYIGVPAVELPYGRKRALEIATTLALDPEMMLLDEPTAGMTHEDVDRTVALIRRVRQGRTILMVEHNLSVVEGLCDRITVLTRGRVLAEGDYAEVSANPDVVAAYLGDPNEGAANAGAASGGAGHGGAGHG